MTQTPSEQSDSTGQRSEDAAPLTIPSRVGKYKILKRIGWGGMGEVLLAEDEYSNRVALKVLSTERMVSPANLRRFIREGQTLSMLQHHNICKVYGIEQIDGRPYIVMEYIQGVSLSRLLSYLSDSSVDEVLSPAAHRTEDLSTIVDRAERTAIDAAEFRPRRDVPVVASRILPLQQSLSIVVKLCDAVQYAHERAVLHRDVKPSNVIVRHDGEPVLLDFGIAKLTDDKDEAALTLSGQIMGTMEYMAPEQARSSRDVDERADVYSIGAVLYELVTGRKQFYSSGDLIQDIKELEEHEPIRPRAHTHRVDKELQAILQKALSAERERRYRSARQLGEDLKRYQEGLPILARPPTVWYRIGKYVRRHRTPALLSGVIAVLALLSAGYLVLDYYRQWGNWVRVLSADFVAGEYRLNDFSFVSYGDAEAPTWRVDSLGLAVPPGEWCWLRNLRVPGNVRVVVDLRFDEQPDGFEMVINGHAKEKRPRYFVPRGYSCQVGGYKGNLDLVSINKMEGMATVLEPVQSRVVSRENTTVTFERRDQRIALFVNGRKQVEKVDKMPFWGPAFGRIGFHHYSTSVHVRSIEVYHMSLPRRATPLVAGEALASAGYAREAAQVYLSIADDYPSATLGERALVAACMTAYDMEEEEGGERLGDSIMSILNERFPRSQHWQSVREKQLSQLWRRAEYGKVLRLMPGHVQAYPLTNVAIELKNMFVGTGIPAGYKEELFQWVVRVPGVTSIDAGDMTSGSLEMVRGLNSLRTLQCHRGEIDDLSPLAGLKLTWLLCSFNRVVDLSPLSGHPLRYLGCHSNRIRDLSPLQGMPLKSLELMHNEIEDISALSASPLEFLNIGDNIITDLGPLRGMKIMKLDCSMNQIADLGPLRGMPLEILYCRFNRVSDLSPLRGAPLRELYCGGNPIGDISVVGSFPLRRLQCVSVGLTSLSAVRGLALEELRCTDNQIRDLSPLRGMPLKSLFISQNNITSLEPIRGMRLGELACDANRIESLEPLRDVRPQALDCSDNPLTTLEPFIANPPAQFSFYCPSLPLSELDTVIGLWRTRPEHAAATRNARILRAFLLADGEELKQMAMVHEGRRYLFVPWRKRWEEADSLSRLVGGHLVTITSDSESRAVLRTTGGNEFTWLSLVRKDGKPVWITGESLDYIYQEMHGPDRGGHWVYGSGASNWPALAFSQFVIEWDQ